jgi:hypothetical protein
MNVAARLPSSTRISRQIIRRIDRGRRVGAGKDSRQNGAGPRPASDIKVCVARTRRVPVTAT